jgi:adenosylmethionine-8-amino-7-oxononanoate aminotransferase
MFGAQKYDYQPDILTSAKGLTSGYSPLGAAIISEAVFEPFGQGNTAFPHGYTFGGHPVSCAVALANLDLFEREDLLGTYFGRITLSGTRWSGSTTCRSSVTCAEMATSMPLSW